MTVLRLSQSQLRRSRWCLRLLRYENVEHRTSLLTSADAARGLAVHDATGANLQHRIDHGRYLGPRRLGDLAADAFEVQAWLVDWHHEDEKRGEVKDHAIALSLAHNRQIAQDVIPLEVEFEVAADLPDIGVSVSGRVDLLSRAVFTATASGPWGERSAIGRDYQLRETKTVASSQPVVRPADEDQVVLYQIMLRAMGKAEADLLVDYCWPQGGGKTKTIAVEHSKDRELIVLDDLRNLRRVYETGLFPRTGRGSWICRPEKCAHYGYCVLGPGRFDL